MKPFPKRKRAVVDAPLPLAVTTDAVKGQPNRAAVRKAKAEARWDAERQADRDAIANQLALDINPYLEAVEDDIQFGGVITRQITMPWPLSNSVLYTISTNTRYVVVEADAVDNGAMAIESLKRMYTALEYHVSYTHNGLGIVIYRSFVR